MKFKTQLLARWYLTLCSRRDYLTALSVILFLLEVRIKSIVDEEFSVKCVGSLNNCSRLNCRHNSCIFMYEVSFKVSKLKLPVSKIFLYFSV